MFDDEDVLMINQIVGVLYHDLGFSVENCNKILAYMHRLARRQTIQGRRQLLVLRNAEQPQWLS